jgi:hypothetical protein
MGVDDADGLIDEAHGLVEGRLLFSTEKHGRAPWR